MRARTHRFIVRTQFGSPASGSAGARVSVVCNPPPREIPLNRPHQRAKWVRLRPFWYHLPLARKSSTLRGDSIHVHTDTSWMEFDSCVGEHMRANVPLCVERCFKSLATGRERERERENEEVEELVARRVGRKERGRGRRAYFRIQRTTRRRGRKVEVEEEEEEEEEEEKEVSFRGTSRVGNRLNFCHPLRHISLLGHLPPSPLSFAPLLTTRLVSPRHRLPYPRARSLHVPRPVRGNFFLVELSLKRDSKDSRVC